MATVDGLGRVFLGFRVKEPWVPDAAWFPRADTGVEVVCSVSDCLAEPPPGWIERWDFNRARCYDTEAAALATIPLGQESRFACFAYHLVPAARESGRMDEPADEPFDEPFDERLPPLPAESREPGELAAYVRLGYDVVSVDMTRGFECSPLSCNGMAKEIPVNRYCLLEDLEQALGVAARFDQEQPEPGDYFVVGVNARGADIKRVTRRA